MSITVCKTEKGFVGIDLKFGQTPAAGLAMFVCAVQQPTMTGEQSFNLSELPTRRVNF